MSTSPVSTLAYAQGIVPHESLVTEANVDTLREMSFVFITADSGEAKRLISEKLVGFGVSFIDVGMGLWENEAVIGGSIRTTVGTPEEARPSPAPDLSSRRGRPR